jgi:hypothetical protein
MSSSPTQIALGDFLHIVDSWLAPKGAGASMGAEGAIEIEAGEGQPYSVELVQGGQMQIFASVGHADAERLRLLVGEDDYGDEIQFLEPVLAWRSASANWMVEVRIADGLTVLNRQSAASGSTDDWHADATDFEAALAGWRAWLSGDVACASLS